MITVASEIMAVLCLAHDLMDLKKRMGDIIVAYDLDGNPVHARQLGVRRAMAILMKDAIKPNIVGTTENTHTAYWSTVVLLPISRTAATPSWRRNWP